MKSEVRRTNHFGALVKLCGALSTGHADSPRIHKVDLLDILRPGTTPKSTKLGRRWLCSTSEPAQIVERSRQSRAGDPSRGRYAALGEIAQRPLLHFL